MARVLSQLAAVALALCTATTTLAQDRPSVVTVNFALKYFAERLTGDQADVVFPVPQGVDPSFWRPSVADISMIQSADLILLNGAGFATWINRVSLPRARLVNTTAKIEDQFIVTQSITHNHGDGGEHAHEGLASYTWLDPMLAIAQAEAIAAALTARGLAPAEDVQARLDALRSELEALDADARAALEGLQDTAIIATHPRYQYLARRYDLSIASLEWDAGAMPAPEDLADLETLIAQTGARVLIWEAQPPEAAVAAANELGVQSVVFNPLASGGTNEPYVAAFEAAVAALSDAANEGR